MVITSLDKEKTYCETKTYEVISSCVTQEQLNCANKYAILYYKKYNDLTVYSYFLKLIKDKNSKLSLSADEVKNASFN